MFKKLLEKLAHQLDQQKIPYMIIGGQAVLLYGEPRLTRDIDITLGVGLDRLSDILNFCRKLKLKVLVDAKKFTRETLVLPCEDSGTGIRVDLIFSYSDYENAAIKRVRRVRLGKTRVNFAAPEDLIVHKMIAGRPRDIEDVEGIVLKCSDLDLRYLRKWLAEFSKSLDQHYLKKFEHILKQ